MHTLLKKTLLTSGLLLLILLITQACSAEKRLARKLTQTNDSIRICLIDPMWLLKENLKTWEIPGYDTLSPAMQDSMKMASSKYLKLVNDSMFVVSYTVTLRTELAKFGLRVFPQDSMDAFLADGGIGYIFNVAQMSLEEYYELFKKTLGLDTSYYRWEIWCNAMAMNVWFEATPMNASDNKMKILFGNMFVRDNVKGKFVGDFMNGDINYVYNVDTIDVNSAYRLARRLAKTHAGFIFDYVMNDRIAKKTGIPSTKENYLHYDVEKRKFVKAGESRFTEM